MPRGRPTVRPALLIALSLACGPAVCPAATNIPLRVAAGILLVDAWINGSGPHPFILDTGATDTILTPPLAKELGLRSHHISSTQRRAVAASVRVGDAELLKLPVYVTDPPQALPLRLDRGIHYAGLIGSDFLARFDTTVDYGRRTVRFAPLDARGRQAAPSNAVPMDLRAELPHVPGVVNGGPRLRLLLDTGSAEVLLTPRAAQAIGVSRGLSAGPEFVMLQSLQIGPERIRNVPAIVHALARETADTLTYDGIVGYPFLQHFAVRLNYRDHFVELTPSRPLTKPAANGH